MKQKLTFIITGRGIVLWDETTFVETVHKESVLA